MPRRERASHAVVAHEHGEPAGEVVGYSAPETVIVPLGASFGELSARVRPLVISGFMERKPPVNLVCMWDQNMGTRITDLSATSLRVSYLPDYAAVTTPAPFTALDDLARWTALPNERLAFMFDASRRSIYNWRQGAPVAGDTGGRIIRAHDALQPLGARYAPKLLREWLESQDPSPIQLLRDERWSELDARIREQLQPFASHPLVSSVEAQGNAHTFGTDTRQLMLERFRSGPELAPRRAEWEPRELTGLGDEEQDQE